MDAIEELKGRILELEKTKERLEDLIKWRGELSPKLEADISALKASLHETRELLNKKEAKKDENEGGEFYGYFPR